MIYLLDAIIDAARAHLPAPTQCKLGQGTQELPEPASGRPTLALVTSVLNDLFAGMTLKTTASRRGVSETDVRIMVEGVITALSRVRSQIMVDTAKLSDAQALEATLACCSHINVDFSRLSNPRWMYSTKLAANCNEADLKELTEAWLDLVHFGNINTPEEPNTVKVIRGLKLLGISVNRIVARINPRSTDQGPHSRSVNFLKHHFQLHFGSTPQFEVNKHRRGTSGRHGREPLYLQVLTRAIKPDEIVPPALNDTKTLNALLLGAVAYLNMNKEN